MTSLLVLHSGSAGNPTVRFSGAVCAPACRVPSWMGVVDKGAVMTLPCGSERKSAPSSIINSPGRRAVPTERAVRP